MDANDFDDFRDVINSTAELYSKTDLSEFALSLWWKALEHYSFQEVKSGLSRHIRNPDNGQFMPKPADVVRAIGGTSQDNSAHAWSKVDKAVRTVGTYQDVVFDDPYIHAVLDDMGGWIRLGTETEEAWPFIQREFETRYRGLMTRGANPDCPKQLIGITNANNKKNNFKPHPPVLIGNESKARLVLQRGVEQVGHQKSIGQVLESVVVQLSDRRKDKSA